MMHEHVLAFRSACHRVSRIILLAALVAGGTDSFVDHLTTDDGSHHEASCIWGGCLDKIVVRASTPLFAAVLLAELAAQPYRFAHADATPDIPWARGPPAMP